MAEKDPLDQYTLLQSIHSPVLRCNFLCAFFDVDIDLSVVQSTDKSFSSFFARYDELCALAANKHHFMSTLTHHQLCQIKNLIKPGIAQRALLTHLQDESLGFSFSLDFASTALDLCSSVWLMIAIGSFPGDLSYDEPILWDRGPLFSRSLIEIPNTKKRKESVHIADIHAFSPKFTTKDIVKLPQSFTAAHLEEIAGIEIHWTSNLADHLLLRDDDTKLFIFHHVSMLDLHMSSPSSPFPWDLLDETIRTISLLLPPILGEPNPWFQREAKKGLDTKAGLCKRLNSTERQIGKFLYWRDRLVLLKRTYDEAEPSTLKQLWNDDRRKTQWFTFWVAVLVFAVTVFFGVVQSVAAWVQAWASVQQLRNG